MKYMFMLLSLLVVLASCGSASGEERFDELIANYEEKGFVLEEEMSATSDEKDELNGLINEINYDDEEKYDVDKSSFYGWTVFTNDDAFCGFIVIETSDDELVSDYTEKAEEEELSYKYEDGVLEIIFGDCDEE